MLILVFSLLCSVLGFSSAFAEGYVALYGGGAFPQNFDNVEGRGDLSSVTLSSLKFDTGLIVGAKIGGYTSPKGIFGLELDGSYAPLKLKQQSVTVSIPGFGTLPPGTMRETDVDVIVGALHVLARYPGDMFQPYLGAGPAVVHAKVESSNLFNSGTATNLGLSAVGGLRLKLSEAIGLFVEYKFIRAALEFDDIQGDATLHAGVGGVSFHF